jgi:hypothetical protein
MSSGASGEVVHCPKCNEDVPKTLYCLNCGYPLYKEGEPKEEKAEPEVKKEPEAKPEPAKPAEEDAVIMVDDEEEEKPVVEEPTQTPVEEPKVEEKPAEKETAPIEEPKIEEKPEPVVEIKEEPTVEAAPEPQVEIKEEPPVETPTQPETVVVAEETKPEPEAPATTLVVEESAPEPEETIAPTPVEPPQAAAPSEPLITRVEPTNIEAVELVEEHPTPKTFVPDPLTKDLLDNFAKNITLKIKLVKLYRDGAIKEETFLKLFEGYAAEGKIWTSRREEILKKLTAEVEEMEDAYEKASDALELLEVRHSIGEATADEYAAKAPAYRWDIDHFDNAVGEKKNKSSYLENISNALTAAEMKELRELASIQYNTLESLQISKDEFLAAIKDDLYDAIKILG